MQNQDAGDTKNKKNNDASRNDAESHSKEINKDPRQEGVDGDALAWLEGPAFNSPIEEMPTLQWPDINSDPDIESLNAQQQDKNRTSKGSEIEEPGDNLEDAMNWLEELAAGQGTPIAEMPTLISGGQYDEHGPEDFSDTPQPMEITGKTSTLADHDSDPMAWLEQLAADQNSPLEELPSVADRLLASEIISQNEVEPNDFSSLSSTVPLSLEVDQALIYLEQKASKNGIDLNQVDIDQLQLDASIDNSLEEIDKLSIADVNGSIESEPENNAVSEPLEKEWEDLSSQIPEDPDEALKWLGGLASDDEGIDVQAVDNDAPEVHALESAVLNKKISGQVDDVQTFEDMPDDPDEAMVWMQKLADQGESRQDKSPIQQADKTITAEPTENLEQNPLDSEIVAHARNALDEGEVDKAVEYYQDLLESGNGGQGMIRELENAVEKVPGSADLFRLLGDAYMQDGQMQKALKTYRKGFDHL